MTALFQAEGLVINFGGVRAVDGVSFQVKAGEVFTERNVRSIRPGHGLPPKFLPTILGRAAARDIARGTPLAWDLIAR